MSKELVDEFLRKLSEPDPPHALLLVGVSSASKWITALEEGNKKIIYNFMEQQLKQKGDLPIKELIVKVLQNVGGTDSVRLLDMIIEEGAAQHGEYLVLDAINAKIKLTNG